MPKLVACTLVTLASLSLAALGGCAEPVVEEAEGSTQSSILGDFQQTQGRMRQARRLLVLASNGTQPGEKSDLVTTAIAHVDSGIDFDNTHFGQNEGNRNTEIDNVAVRETIATCNGDVDCLLEGAQLKLKGATRDKGGFRVLALRAIADALAIE